MWEGFLHVREGSSAMGEAWVVCSLSVLLAAIQSTEKKKKSDMFMRVGKRGLACGDDFVLTKESLDLFHCGLAVLIVVVFLGHGVCVFVDA
jgi:hypothetical protein